MEAHCRLPWPCRESVLSERLRLLTQLRDERRKVRRRAGARVRMRRGPRHHAVQTQFLQRVIERMPLATAVTSEDGTTEFLSSGRRAGPGFGDERVVPNNEEMRPVVQQNALEVCASR